jgi:uncharacterized protein
MNKTRRILRSLLFVVTVSGSMCAGVSFAQTLPDLNVATPAILTIKKSMANRFAQLKPHLDAGTVGLTHDGVIALRDPASIDVKALLVLDALIVEENKDRSTLYREIARANNHADWESDLRITFGKRWIDRMPAGWFYRDEKGQWLRK